MGITATEFKEAIDLLENLEQTTSSIKKMKDI